MNNTVTLEQAIESVKRMAKVMNCTLYIVPNLSNGYAVCESDMLHIFTNKPIYQIDQTGTAVLSLEK